MSPVRPALEPVVVALARVDLCAAALAGFLVRGGVILFLLPIVWLPSPLDLADVFSSAVTSAALGGPNPELVRLVVLAAIGVTAVVVAAFWLGALMDVAVVRIAASSLVPGGGATSSGPDSPAPGSATEAPGPDTAAPGLSESPRALAVRLVALVPAAVVLAVAAPAVVAATYRELIDPSTLAVPLVLRVLGDVPLVVALLVATWLAGDAIGGLAVRLVVLERRRPLPALAGAIGLVVRRPLAAAATFAAGSVVVIVLVAPALLAAAVAWRGVLFATREDAGPIPTALGILALAGLWLGGLVLAGFAAAVRAILWSTFAARR